MRISLAFWFQKSCSGYLTETVLCWQGWCDPACIILFFFLFQVLWPVSVSWVCVCVQVWSYFSHPECINQCCYPPLASLQWIAAAFRIFAFSVSFVFRMFWAFCKTPVQCHINIRSVSWHDTVILSCTNIFLFECEQVMKQCFNGLINSFPYFWPKQKQFMAWSLQFCNINV